MASTLITVTLSWAWLFPLLGALSFFNGLYILLGGLASKKWPTTTGLITKSELKQRLVRANRGLSQNVYQMIIAYDYMVNEKHYKGTKHMFYNFAISYNREVKLNELAQFPVGAVVPVFYYPRHPKIAVLLPGLSLYTCWVMILGGMCFIVVGILLMTSV